MNDQKNTLLAIVLSAIVLIGWQIFFGVPQLQKQQQQQAQEQQRSRRRALRRSRAPAQPVPGSTPAPSRPASPAPTQAQTREAALAASPRVQIETPSLPARSRSRARASTTSRSSSIARRSIPNSPPIVLLAPSGSPHPFYAEFGWSVAAGTTAKLPGADTLWRQQGIGRARRSSRPVTLDLGQRRGPGIPPHHRGRRQVPVHRQGRGRQQERGGGRRSIPMR